MCETLRKALVLAALAAYAAGAAWAQDAPKALPEAARAAYERAGAARAAGDTATAVRLFEEAHALAPDDVLVTSALVRALFAAPEHQTDGLKLLDELLATKRDDPNTQATLVVLLFGRGAYDKIALADRLLKHYPDDPNFQEVIRIKLTEEAKRDPALARVHARELLDPAARVGARRAGYNFLSHEAADAGRGAFDALVADTRKRGENDGYVYVALSETYRRNFGDPATAKTLLETAKQLAEAKTPPDENLVGLVAKRTALADLAILAGRDPAAAVARARELMANEKDRDQWYEYFSRVLEDAKARGPADVAKLAAEVLGLPNPLPYALVDLGAAYDVEKSDPDLGVRLLLAVVGPGSKVTRYDISPFGRVELRLKLGSAYLVKGDATRALEALDGIDPTTNTGKAAFVLGLAYLKAGDAVKAYGALLTAVALLPSSERRSELLVAAKAAGRTDAAAATVARREELAKPAADFTLKSLDGRSVTLSGLRGKVVLLSFWFPT